MLQRVLNWRTLRLASTCKRCLRLAKQRSEQSAFSKCYSSQKQETKEESGAESQGEDAGKTYQLIDFELPKSVGPVPIKNLQVLKNIKKIRKESSFLINLFLGVFDKDFLTYPEVLYGRETFLNLRNQHEMIRRHFPEMIADTQSVSKFNFDRLWTLSISEMTNIFEAIGESLSLTTTNVADSQSSHLVPSDESATPKDGFNRPPTHPVANPDIQNMLFALILHNCISMQSVRWTKNEQLKQYLTDAFESNEKMQIGFGWTEKELGLGALAYPDWSSEARLSTDKSSWVVSGRKTRILRGDYDHYLVFCRTTDYPDEDVPRYLLDQEKPPVGIVGVLLKKDQIAKIEYEKSENGIDYQTITFDSILLPREHFEVMPAEQFGVDAQNLRGVGHIATASFLLGQMKVMLNTLYRYLIEERKPLTECEIIGSMLADMTYKIYGLESVVYMVGAMYDFFDERFSKHIYMEAAAAKILAIEYSRDVIRKAQTIYGSKMLVTSPFEDLVNILDSFLDGSVHHRILIGLQGAKHVGQYKNDYVQKTRFPILYPGHALKSYYQRKKLKSDEPFQPRDLKGYCHPSLFESGKLLESSLNKLELACECLLLERAKGINESQIDLDRLSRMATEVFMLACTVSRASRSYSDGTRNGDAEVSCTNAISDGVDRRMRQLYEEIRVSGDFNSNEPRHKVVHKRNLKHYGYFAYSPLDKTFY